MLERDLSQIERHVRIVCNSSDVFDTVDLLDHFLHCEIPSIVYDVYEFDFGNGDVP